jgi:agmatine/peptidylarginine deiminase
MKYFLILLVLISFFVTAPILSAEENDQNNLPIGLTEDELLRLDEIGIAHKATMAPGGILRNPAEWEPSEGVIIRWPLGISYSLIAEMSEDVMVTTIVGSSSQETTARNSYAANGVNMSNTQFIIAATNSIWTRDYGPWFIFEDEQLAIVDHIYNRPRPLDDVIPQTIGSLWGLTVYGMNLIHTGGNHMSDGLGRSFSTRLVYDENPSLSSTAVDSIMKAYLGNDYTVLAYIESGGIHHIDCWAKLLNPGTILVKDVSPSNPSYALLNARAAYLSQQISPWGRPYNIVRVYCPNGTAYTNSLILNNKVFVPIFGDSYDDDAIQTYQDAMPGYEILGFTGSWLDDDAIHCRTMGVPDRYMLDIKHVPLPVRVSAAESILVGTKITACSGEALIEDSLKIYYSLNDRPFISVPMSIVGKSDSVTGYIPIQAPGTSIKYIIRAADQSGRVENHPYIGMTWPHETVVNYPPEILGADTIYAWSGESFKYYPSIDDPDDTEHIISYSGMPIWLTVHNDTLTGTVPAESPSFSFNVACSDGIDATQKSMVIRVYTCGDATGEGSVDLLDILYLIANIYNVPPGPDPEPYAIGDVNSDGNINLLDILYLIDYLYGDPPGDAPECSN